MFNDKNQSLIYAIVYFDMQFIGNYTSDLNLCVLFSIILFIYDMKKFDYILVYNMKKFPFYSSHDFVLSFILLCLFHFLAVYLQLYIRSTIIYIYIFFLILISHFLLYSNVWYEKSLLILTNSSFTIQWSCLFHTDLLFYPDLFNLGWS